MSPFTAAETFAGRSWSIFAVAVIFASIFLHPCSTTSAGIRTVDCFPVISGASQRVYIYNPSGDERTLLDFRQMLLKRGACHLTAVLPYYIVCRLPMNVSAEELAAGTPLRIASEEDVEKDVSGKMYPEFEWLKRSCSLARTLSAPDEAVSPLLQEFRSAGGFRDSLLAVPKELIRTYRPDAGTTFPSSLSRNIDQNCEFMVGNIVVNLILPESMGNIENWSDQELLDAIAGATAGLMSFQEMFSYIPMNFIVRSFEKIPTKYEPITWIQDSHYIWIREVMKNLNYNLPWAHEYIVHKFNNDSRRRYGSDWVFTAFIVNSEYATSHRFPNADYVAYSYQGGPYLVIPFPSGEFQGIYDESFLCSLIFQHEVAHIFWALDEFFTSRGDCTARAGYLNYANENKIEDYIMGVPVNNCGQIEACIMDHPEWYWDRPVCPLTAGQIGIADKNNNAVPDVLDSIPVIQFENALPETVSSTSVSIRARVISVPIPNRNYAQDTTQWISYTSPLKDGVVNMNGIGYSLIFPEDGTWDETEEDIVINTGALSVGLTEIMVKVRNKIGLESEVFEKLIYKAGLRFTSFYVDLVNDGIKLSWNMISETFDAKFDLYRIEEGTPNDTLIIYDLQPAGDPYSQFIPYEYFDREVEPTQVYRYFVKGTYILSIGGGPKETFTAFSDMIDIKAMIPINAGDFLSYPVPNPTNSSVSFSIMVPESFKETGPDQARLSVEPEGTAYLPGLIREVQTPVEVVVYDVTGRLVKRVYRGAVYSAVITHEWDGTNQRNEIVPSGVYILKVRAGAKTRVRKIVVVR